MTTVELFSTRFFWFLLVLLLEINEIEKFNVYCATFLGFILKKISSRAIQN